MCLICTGCNGRVTYAIVKVYVTERNDVMKCHSYVIIIWRMSAMEVTSILKNLRSEICLCWGFMAQSTQWGHVERGQFT